MKKMIFTISVIFATSVLFAQTGEIKGKVVDTKTKETLISATIFVKYGDKIIATTTDGNGNFTLKPLQSGVYNLCATLMGYDTVNIKGITVSSDQITFLKTIELVDGITLGGVTIKYEEPLIERVDRKELSGDELGQMATRDLKAALPSLSSDITASEDGEIYFRGSRSGDAAYYVDGVKVDDLKVPSSAIKSMNVYTGGVPAKYGDFMGGCVAVETLSYFDWLNMQRAKENKRAAL